MNSITRIITEPNTGLYALVDADGLTLKTAIKRVWLIAYATAHGMTVYIVS